MWMKKTVAMHREEARIRAKLGHVEEDERTPVIFRKWPKSKGGGIIALFPYNPGNSEYNCDSYEHVGGHGTASLDPIHRTKPAKPEEYADLKKELESAPYFYNLKVIERVPADALDIRRRKVC
jgi:hypothetical protein